MKVAILSRLEVDNDTAFNIPTTGTPTPASKMSSETLATLQEASNKLWKLKRDPPRAPKEREPAPLHLIDSQLVGTGTHLSPSLCTSRIGTYIGKS